MCRTAYDDPPSPEKTLVIDERYAAVHDAARLPISALGVERARARRRVIGVEPDRLRRPLARHALRLVEQEAPDTAALRTRVDCHVEQIERTAYLGEVRGVDGPWLLRDERQ